RVRRASSPTPSSSTSAMPISWPSPPPPCSTPTSASTANRRRASGRPSTTTWPDARREPTASTATRSRTSASTRSPNGPGSLATRPATTSRTRSDPSGTASASRRPAPVADLGRVLAVLVRVDAGVEATVPQAVGQATGALEQPRHPLEHVEGEVEPVEVVASDHVERRAGRPLLLVTADVEVVVVVAAVGQAVDEPRVAVIGEHHRLVG